MKYLSFLLFLGLTYNAQAQVEGSDFEHPQIALFAGEHDELGKIAFFYTKSGMTTIDGDYLRIGNKKHTVRIGTVNHKGASLEEGETEFWTEEENLWVRGKLTDGNTFKMDLRDDDEADKKWKHKVTLTKVEPSDKRAGIYKSVRMDFAEHSAISLYPDGKGDYLISMFWVLKGKEEAGDYQDIRGKMVKVDDNHYVHDNTDDPTDALNCRFHFEFSDDDTIEFWIETEANYCLGGLVRDKKYMFEK